MVTRVVFSATGRVGACCALFKVRIGNCWLLSSIKPLFFCGSGIYALWAPRGCLFFAPGGLPLFLGTCLLIISMQAHLVKQPQDDATYLWQTIIRAFRFVLGSFRSSLFSSCVPSASRFDWDLRQIDVITLLRLLSQGLRFGTYIRILCWWNALSWNWWRGGNGALRLVSAFKDQCRNCSMALTGGLKAGKGSCC